jgi:DNA modification methylase
MIPQIARRLLQEYRPEGKFELVFDPYMGSGTTLVEAKIIGIRSIGTDINPLAQFITKSKITNFDINKITNARLLLIEAMSTYIPNFDFTLENVTNWEFWYDKNKVSELLFLTHEISKLESKIQDFFKISLSECVREVSFTRNNEFKRYKMSHKKLETFNPDTFRLFINKIDRNLIGLQALNNVNSDDIASVCSFNSVVEIPSDIIIDGSVDMVVTSPPYGDSRTTVAYGQFSRWANEWFNFDNAKSLDSILMGGRKINKYSFETDLLTDSLTLIKNQDQKRYHEVLDFLEEYYLSMKNVAQKVRSGGRVCYVVGNRTVKGVQISLDYFTVETFERLGFKELVTYVRDIPNKRMPSVTSPTNVKGNHVNTMSNEFIVILEKQ